jgi:hypothetical protein
MMTHRGWLLFALVTVMLAAASVNRAAAQWQIATKDGNASIKVGFLAQPQLEMLETPTTATITSTDWSKNLFLRRFRILFGGKIAKDWSYFFETDSPNLGKSNPDKVVNPTGVKDTGTIFLQDAFVTYEPGMAFKVDAGMILTPLSHNHTQSAATLLPVDYGPYTFNESAVMQERVGRDYGVQVRGYPLAQHVEYRLGVFQGVRGVQATNNFAVAGRVVWYPFAADTGFFYGGTFQGQKRIVGVGASFETQKEYHEYAIDGFIDQPIHDGQEGFTAQFDWMRFDGGTFLPALPKQDTYLFEGGFHFGKGHYTPFFQYSNRNFVNAALADTKYWQAGLAWWMSGSHQRNIKFSAGQQLADKVPNRTQVLLQLQLFFY